MKKIIKTPRAYLSWSQLNTWERSPAMYKRIYFYGEEINNPAMELGKEVAQCLETGEESENIAIEHLKIFLPSYKFREYEIQAEVEKIPLLGRLDGFGEDPLEIGEYKTGKNWTQKMVDTNGQLTFYALLVLKKFKKFPERIRLHWAKTISEDGEIKLTGDIQSFETKRTLADIVSIAERCKKAWKGIKLMAKQI